MWSRMWRHDPNDSGSDDFSDSEYTPREDKENWSLTQFKCLKFPKEDGKTIFDIGKCGKFCMDIKLTRSGQYHTVELSLISPCPMWIRRTSEIEDDVRPEVPVRRRDLFPEDYMELDEDEEERDDGDEFINWTDWNSRIFRLRGAHIDLFEERPRVLYRKEKANKPEVSEITLYLKYRTPMTCVSPACKKNAAAFPLLSSLSSSLEELFESGQGSDAVFQVGDVEIPAHKLILSSRYDYFKKIFESGMKESTSNRVMVHDATPDTFKEVLRFVYRGLPPKDLREKASEYLPIADFYGMEDLKTECVNSIRWQLKSDDIFETYSMGQLHNCRELTTRVQSLVDDKSFKPSQDLLQKAVDYGEIAERDGKKGLQSLCSTVFGKLLSRKNVFRALELSQRHQCPKLVDEVLRYAARGFHGSSDDEALFEEAAKQLPIADRDENENLKKVCVGMIKNLITKKNFCEIILLAHQNQCPNLKKHCLRQLDGFKDHPAFKDKTTDEAFPLLDKEPEVKAEVKAVWDAIQLLQATRK